MAKKKTVYTVSDGKMVLTLEPAEKGWFVVTCPFDPALNTQAKTLQGAFEMAYDAAALLKEARTMEKQPHSTSKRARVKSSAAIS